MVPVSVNEFLLASRIERSRLATASLFLLNGSLLATWATEVPRIKAALGLSELQLGFVLLAFTAGSALILPVIGWILTQYGIRAVATLATLLAALALTASAFATHMLSLSLALLVFGVGFGALDVALNNAGVLLEREVRRPLMSGLHAMYSLGALIGAIFGGALIRVGLSSTGHVIFLLFLSFVAAFIFAQRLPRELEAPSDDGAEAAPVGRTWSLPLMCLGLLAACAAIAEGAVADWVGIYLRETALAPSGGEVLGFAGFSLLMLVGRLFGDRLSENWGPVLVGQLGSGLAIIGLALALGFPSVVPVMGGFALMGLGISVLAPLAFSAVGRISPQNTASAIAGVTAFFYIGYLAGPPVIGVLAHLGSLRSALTLLVLTSLVAACLSPVLRVKPGPERKVGPA